MKLGIVGLPNVGKSTLFNAITSTKNAEAANYPFCTIEPNSGIVAVPDKRLDKLAEVWQTNKKTPAIVEFVDIAGLVKGASQGAGLGNKFLGHIREWPISWSTVCCSASLSSKSKLRAGLPALRWSASCCSQAASAAAPLLLPLLAALAIRPARFCTTSRSERISS